MEMGSGQAKPFFPGQRVRVTHVPEDLEKSKILIGEEGVVLRTLYLGFVPGGGVLLKLDEHSGPTCFRCWCLERVWE